MDFYSSAIRDIFATNFKEWGILPEDLDGSNLGSIESAGVHAPFARS